MLRALICGLLGLFSLVTINARSTGALSLSGSIDDSALVVQWANHDTSSLLLNLGGMMRDHPLYAMRLTVSGISSEPQSLSIGADTVAIEGRIDPWVVILPANAVYTLRFPLHSLLLKDGRSLGSVKLDHWTLTIAFTGQDAYDHAPGGRKTRYSITQNGETDIPFWKGTKTVQIKH